MDISKKFESIDDFENVYVVKVTANKTSVCYICSRYTLNSNLLTLLNPRVVDKQRNIVDQHLIEFSMTVPPNTILDIKGFKKVFFIKAFSDNLI